jgi:hypothetical protein
MSGSSSSRATLISSPESVGSTSPKLRINLDSGATVVIDVAHQLDEWDALKADPTFQGRIRGFVLTLNGRTYALCAPRGFRRVVYDVEAVYDRDHAPDENVPPTAIRATYVADVILAAMTLDLNDQPVVRFDVKLTGKLRWQAP